MSGEKKSFSKGTKFVAAALAGVAIAGVGAGCTPVKQAQGHGKFVQTWVYQGSNAYGVKLQVLADASGQKITQATCTNPFAPNKPIFARNVQIGSKNYSFLGGHMIWSIKTVTAYCGGVAITAS